MYASFNVEYSFCDINFFCKRISSVSSANNLITTAFKNVDGSIIVVVMNQGDTEINYSVTMNLKTAELRSLPHSIQTIVL